MSRRRVAVQVQDGRLVYQPFVEGVDPTPPGVVLDSELLPGSDLSNQIASQQAADRARARAAEDPNAAGVFGMGVLDELLLGLPSAARRAYLESGGAANRDAIADMQAQRDESPGANAAGRVVGALAPAVFSGGTSALARGLAATPGGLAIRAGNLAEGALARALAGRVGGQTAARVAGMALDGALSAAQMELTQANIDGTPLNAEHLVGSVGLGTLLGAGFGGLSRIPLPFRRGVRQADNALARQQAEVLEAAGLDDVAGASRQGIPVRPLQVAEGNDAWFATAAAASGVDERALRQFRAAQEAGVDIFDRGAFQQRVYESAGSMENTFQRVDAELSGITNASRRQQAVLQGLDGTANPQVVADTFTQARRQLQDLVEGSVERGVARLANESDRTAAQNLIRQLDNLSTRTTSTPRVRATRQGIEHSVIEGTESSITDGAAAVRAVDEALDYLSNNQLMRSATPELRVAIENTRLGLLRAANEGLGEAGGRLVAAHEALAALRNTYDEVIRSIGGETAQPLAGSASRVLRIDRNKLSNVLQDQMGEEVRDTTIDQLGSLMARYNEALDAVEALGVGAQSAALRGELDSLAARLADDRGFSQLRTSLRHAGMDESQGSGLMAALGISGRGLGASLVGAVAGGALGGPVGGLVGSVVGGAIGLPIAALTHPVAAMQRRVRLQQTLGSFRERYQSGMSGLGNMLRRGGRFVASSGRVLPRLVVNLQTQSRRKEEYRAIVEQVRTYSSNPEALSQRISEAVGPVAEQVSGPLGDNAALTVARGVGYLSQHIPPADLPTPFSHLEDIEPSAVEMDSFIRRFHAVEDPLSILEMAQRGTLTVEHVEAVRAVYPQLFTAMQAELTQTIADLDELPPYAVRSQIATLLDTPLDSTMDSRFIHSMQQSFAQTQQQDRAQTSTSVRRAVSTQLADRSFSVSEELSLRL